MVNWRDIRNPEAGGAEVHLHEIFRRLAARGHEVTVLASAWPGAPAEEVVDGLRTLRRGRKHDFNFHVPTVWRRELRHEPFDVVVDDINKIPFLTPRYVNRPVLAQTHHFFRQTIFREASLPAALYVYLSECLVPLVYRRCRFAAVSPSSREELVRWGVPAERIDVIYNAVNHDLYRPAGPAERSPEPLIVYLGRLKRYKRIDLFLRAIPLVAARVPAVRVRLVGSGDDRPALERLARRLGISERVAFTGFVSEEEKMRHLQAAWVVANPSSKEGWGVTVIEANACGTPVVAARVPGLQDAVRAGETGLLLSPLTPETLASALTAVLEIEELRARLAAGAVAWARQFTWDRAAEQTEELLRRVIAEAS